jgi:hypothetical protein
VPVVGEDRGLRQEEKEVDGFELEQAEERKRESELIEADEEALYDIDGQPEFEREQERTSTIAGAMRKILEREHIVINDLELDQRELRALEALKTAVDGRDQEIHGFVFAEDRRTLLEQALAVLQPDIANLEKLGGAPFEELVKDVAELRGQLDILEEAQEEIEHHKQAVEKGEASDSADKPDDDASLDGPERRIDKPASTLTGPEIKPEPKPPTTLTGAEIKPEPKPPTTLTGTEIMPEPKPATSLGDPKEIADAAKPWWKR